MKPHIRKGYYQDRPFWGLFITKTSIKPVILAKSIQEMADIWVKFKRKNFRT